MEIHWWPTHGNYNGFLLTPSHPPGYESNLNTLAGIQQ